MRTKRKCPRCGGPFVRALLTGKVCEDCMARAAERFREQKKLRGTIPDAVRRAVIARDGHACRYCGISVRRGAGGRYGERDRLELDHVIPVVDGGASTVENLVVSCLWCNRKKHNRKAVG